MAYTFLTSSKFLILPLWLPKFSQVLLFYLITFHLSNGCCTPIRSKAKKTQDGANILKDVFKPLQLQTKKNVDKYFSFGWHQWLCQGTDFVPPWTHTFEVAKDQVLSCFTRFFLAWHETLSYMKNINNLSEYLTTMWWDSWRPTNLHFRDQHQRLNNTATSPPTTIKFLLKRESRRMKTSTTMANHDPRMNRTNPKYCVLLGIFGTWSTSCDFCNCLLYALCVLDSVCSCLECFLSVYCYLVLVLVFGLLALKPTGV
jgi:hypothetical protein